MMVFLQMDSLYPLVVWLTHHRKLIILFLCVIDAFVSLCSGSGAHETEIPSPLDLGRAAFASNF